jgi:hypothetical protein
VIGFGPPLAHPVHVGLLANFSHFVRHKQAIFRASEIRIPGKIGGNHDLSRAHALGDVQAKSLCPM